MKITKLALVLTPLIGSGFGIINQSVGSYNLSKIGRIYNSASNLYLSAQSEQTQAVQNELKKSGPHDDLVYLPTVVANSTSAIQMDGTYANSKFQGVDLNYYTRTASDTRGPINSHLHSSIHAVFYWNLQDMIYTAFVGEVNDWKAAHVPPTWSNGTLQLISCAMQISCNFRIQAHWDTTFITTQFDSSNYLNIYNGFNKENLQTFNNWSVSTPNETDHGVIFGDRVNNSVLKQTTGSRDPSMSEAVATFGYDFSANSTFTWRPAVEHDEYTIFMRDISIKIFPIANWYPTL